MRFPLNTILALTATLAPAVLASPHNPHGSHGHSHGGNYCSQPINENLMQLTGEANDNAHFCRSLSNGLLSNDVDGLKSRQDQLRDDIFGAYSTLRGSSCTDIYPGAQRDLCRSFVEFTHAEKALQYALRAKTDDLESDAAYEDMIRCEAETQENYYHLADLLIELNPVCCDEIKDATREMNWAFAGTQSKYTSSSH
ncbi:hypothetical protein P168DRAFT_324767 [Aspergillus campestris IBT 28561]|uniref:Uncharacterized protein n=1 Tax=Aspergillus campestris (strain IBT 28561) TaxID=1392248 RepID=A0A2I1DBV5_ASPC2|nr:uncharacterized protein P168DRAFT_324767 [Aspergillus campestris IBT 28561]PKY07341.1 hypothetical protein P168DRAFT_324767 [Aspergillus campestris IBT 28561]